MEKNNKLILLVLFIFLFTSCSTITRKESSYNQIVTSIESSPFSQFEGIEQTAQDGVDSEQVDNMLRSYDIYDKIMEKVSETEYTRAPYSNLSVSGFNIDNKKVAMLLLEKMHLYIYVMFSNINNTWTVDGFAYQIERYEPEFRIEQSNTDYWLVIRYETNHGSGLQIFNEVWYNPDGTVAADYPIEGYTEFFPQEIKPSANATFSSSAYFDGDSTISLPYTINFNYNYMDSYEGKDFMNRFKSSYSPILRENWAYNLKNQELEFVSTEPDLPESFKEIDHEASADFGILQGYIDFYRIQLGNKTISTLEEWERLIGQSK